MTAQASGAQFSAATHHGGAERERDGHGVGFTRPNGENGSNVAKTSPLSCPLLLSIFRRVSRVRNLQGACASGGGTRRVRPW